MSELKVASLFELEKVLHGRSNKLFYSKSEADNVIAEKDKEIAELKALKAQAEDDCAYWKMSEGNAANAMHETEEYAMQLYKELRHQKYKRCEAMAEWCDAESDVADADGDYEDMKWYQKWHNKWLELAELFKE